MKNNHVGLMQLDQELLLILSGYLVTSLDVRQVMHVLRSVSGALLPVLTGADGRQATVMRMLSCSVGHCTL